MSIYRSVTQKINALGKKLFFSKKNTQQEKKNTLHDKFWEFIRRQFNSSIRKKKEKLSKESNKRNKKANSLDSSNFDQQNSNSVEKLLHEYEKMFKHEFFFIINNAKANLRSWHADLTEALTKSDPIPNELLETLTLNLGELQMLFNQTNVLLNRFVDKCNQYDEIVRNAKSLISPNQQLNRAYICLNKLKKDLEKGQKMTNIHNEKEYKFIDNYLKEKGYNSQKRFL